MKVAPRIHVHQDIVDDLVKITGSKAAAVREARKAAGNAAADFFDYHRPLYDEDGYLVWVLAEDYEAMISEIFLTSKERSTK